MNKHAFNLILTTRQKAKLIEAWENHGEPLGVMLCQPRRQDGSFKTLRFAIYDLEAGVILNKAVARANK